MGLKKEVIKEDLFRGEPKGYSVSIPKMVKKPKSSSSSFCTFRFFFFLIRFLRGAFSLDLCQGFKRKGYRIFMSKPSSA
ncbi:hypothetical protein LguiA_022499 [Lonicera macranthoides]